MCRSKHVEQLINIGIISSTTRSHLVGYFYKIYITMNGSMNIKFINARVITNASVRTGNVNGNNKWQGTLRCTGACFGSKGF